MTSRSALLVALLVACLLVGCSGRRDASVDMLERENRQLEDLIWQWKDAYDEKVAELDSVKRASRAAQKIRDRDGDTAPNPTNPASRAKKPETDEMPMVEPPPGDAPGRLDIPEVLPPPTHGSAVGPRGRSVLVPVSGAEEAALDAGEIDPYVTHVVLNEKLTGGFDFDSTQPGDEGLMVVIEPRNAAGKYVPLAGAVTLLLVDPAASGDAAELARWDYEASEAAAYLKKSLFGKGIHLELRWPLDPPTKERLRVVARYTTADGRNLEARRDVRIQLSPNAFGRWTPGSKPTTGDGRSEFSTANGSAQVSFARRNGPLPLPPQADDEPESGDSPVSGDNEIELLPAQPAAETKPPASAPSLFPPAAADENWKPIR